MAVIAKLLLIAAFNVAFYLSALNIVDIPVDTTVYAGLYLIVGLILTISRRVVPSFIQNGVTYEVTLPNSSLLDRSSLILFLGFFIAELFLSLQWLSSSLAMLLFLVNAVRLIGWHTPGIWNKSLLWGLYLSLWFICLGFLLFAAVYFVGISKYLGVHALAVGGIGVITMSMMSRVAWGHTGHDIKHPPGIVRYALILLVASATARVLFPIINASLYTTWVGLSQALWVAAYAVLTIGYLPVLIKPRIDS
jgi:uncharacterized protein involved in response to NO